MKIGVLGSGKGSNFQAILDAIDNGHLKNVEVAVVLSDVEDARILDKAADKGIPAFYIRPGEFKTKLEPEIELQYIEALNNHGVEYVVLAGFMRVIKNKMLHAFPCGIVNIHPSLLPAFKGLEAWKQALDYGAKVTGCSVHLVNLDLDGGPIILQATVPILNDDTPEILHARIQKEEHALLPKALQLLADDKVVLRGRRMLLRSTSRT